MREPTLKREQIEGAIRRKGVRHHVLNVLGSYRDVVQRISRGYDETPTERRESYLAQQAGFLADKFSERDYSLGPLDIVAIWSVAKDICSFRYDLARIVSAAYAVHGIANPEWRRLPRYLLEQQRLPQVAVTDRDGLAVFEWRLDDVHRSLDELIFYKDGTREPFNDILDRSNTGDQEATAALQRVIAREKEVNIPLLGEISENFSNGLIPFGFLLRDIKEGKS